ncbi:unnamed protein product [Owenia fusiformis]|uniref:GST N-terminal domain-containing protein n=1 Tax=Owenia fusiformis TaxID=6347 RepID=A0A8J1TLA4_OWEFU|nr:unnamed protein product [Owenia fusiformis]CAH1802170.1 unnamed protein product [Owenia fusiformis]
MTLSQYLSYHSLRSCQKEEYVANVNPFKWVPTLEVDSDGCIWESSAALQYLAEMDGVPEHWYPKSGRARIMVNTYLASHMEQTRGNIQQGTLSGVLLGRHSSV